ncbi:Glycoside hydrolase, superfamily [Pseudohyphozyma bogoriensis]|nr:Glycoside hydrolase, superfamily [Pseudohyphozyma bogoriensis]
MLLPTAASLWICATLLSSVLASPLHRRDQIADLQAMVDKETALIAAYQNRFNNMKAASGLSEFAALRLLQQRIRILNVAKAGYQSQIASLQAAATSSSLSSKAAATSSTITTVRPTTTSTTTYNWANAQDTSTGTLTAGVEFVPMLWGSYATGWTAAAQAAINAGSTHLLGMNEPDLDTQSNITPAAAAAEWKTYMEPFYGKAKLVSPAITNGGAPMGVTWMSEFLGNCSTCHIDAIAAHCGYFTNYFTDMYNEFKKPIWITEFAGSGTVAQQQSFFQTIIPWMEKNVTFIERYAAFGDFAGTFVNSDGSLTALGQTYKTVV